MTDWHPITEGLPEQGVLVLACTIHVRFIGSVDAWGRFWDDGVNLQQNVVAWMPLPAPYVPPAASANEGKGQTP